ncbi:lipid-binding SYLF domain-containing protein [Motiliproteus sp. SC1-56]|uniref:lipid-binding SYLF domain-containing protein n=1 Tax=Motiliproteus sp. SC1-56 TaxID=2799565 RepID=UPI001A8E7896|nr:lipid-binding SYLF domain-containing protein [Motiliproteus sp. SC1-56]
MVKQLLTVGVALLLGACSGGWTPASKGSSPAAVGDGAGPEVRQTLARFQAQVPALRTYFQQAYGYAVFPQVTKGAFVLGGAFGEGEVYARHRLIGYATLTQVTVGAALGAQTFSEVIFFKDAKALQRFTSGGLELGGQVSLATDTQGASLDLAFHQGVAVFTLSRGGWMVEAALGGQKFDFVPLTGGQRP